MICCPHCGREPTVRVVADDGMGQEWWSCQQGQLRSCGRLIVHGAGGEMRWVLWNRDRESGLAVQSSGQLEILKAVRVVGRFEPIHVPETAREETVCAFLGQILAERVLES